MVPVRESSPTLLLALVRVSVVIAPLFALVIAALRVQPYYDSVLDDFSGCKVSCWHGVEPGIILGKDSLERLNMDFGSEPIISSCFDPPSNFCNRFTWRSQDTLRTTELMINHDRVQSIIVFPPGFTLGEALLTLANFHAGFYGASPPGLENDRFYFQLVFDETRIGFSMAVHCPSTYFAMMQTPVSNISVGTPTANMQQYFSNDFRALRRKWYQLCEL